jgi:hypothetical protein
MGADRQGLANRFMELFGSQYGGFQVEVLADAAANGRPMSFAVYPDEATEACAHLYELDVYSISAGSAEGFAQELAEATADAYGDLLEPGDIYCVDIIS